MFHWFLVWRYFKGESRSVKATSILASVGIILGVACLIVSMAIVSGVQKFIQDSIVDLTGDVLITNPTEKITNLPELEKRIAKATSDFVALTPFASTQGVIVREGKISSVILHGLDDSSMNYVVNLKPRILQGELIFRDPKGGPATAALGKELAKKLNLKIGDIFTVVVPRPSKTKINNFSPVQQPYKVAAIMDFGKYEYNEKVLISSAASVQALAGIGDSYLGVYVKLKNPDLAMAAATKIREELGVDYRVRDWREVNYNFFTAVELEKVVIFVVVLFIVIVASFNISSTLFVSVMRKYSDIAILQTIGADKSFVKKLFTSQGLFLGLIGAFLGTLLGLIFCFLIRHFNFIDIPGDIYKFDRVPLEIRAFDVSVIFVVTVLICYLSSKIPARRGAFLNPVEGLRYE